MSCCGQKRQSWREGLGQMPQSRQPSPPALQNPRVLYYQASSSLLIKGAATGFTYLFAGRGIGLRVDERDIPAFVRMNVFQTIALQSQPDP
jgi:hypothetical protein